MIDLKYFVLEKLYNSPRREVERTELFSMQGYDINNIQRAVSDLKSFGFVKTVIGSDKYHLTNPGIEEYESLKKARDQDAKQEKQKRFDNKMNVASLLIPIITFFAGILVDHYTNIAEFVFSWFTN